MPRGGSKKPEVTARVKELRAEGLCQAEIARQLNMSASAVGYHFRVLGVPLRFKIFRKRGK